MCQLKEYGKSIALQWDQKNQNINPRYKKVKTRGFFLTVKVMPLGMCILSPNFWKLIYKVCILILFSKIFILGKAT